MNEKLITFLATGFGSGLAPFAPGTAGTLVGILICLPLIPLPWILRLLLVLALLALSFYVSDQAEKIYKRKDDQRIVIDEIIGFQITMLPVEINVLSICAGFVLFRIFDIWKPFPVRNMQGFPGGWGIVADDVAAGIYAGMVLWLLTYWRIFT
ncbi:MAG TPA: phosphatidylglycerophosphatase A [Smithellaceae bacterium]|nr:phosphatidylglycerophosphatase A [Smithellaceae bacterium]HOO36139.1 phosphatidylglycerophosphatase A [Smithella sp.]